MVYESDFYTTRRYRTSPSLSTYTVTKREIPWEKVPFVPRPSLVPDPITAYGRRKLEQRAPKIETPGPSRQVRILPGLGKVHVVHTYDRIVPYVGHKRLTVVTSNPPIYKVRPSVLYREYDRIVNKYRPITYYSAVNDYLNSDSAVSSYLRYPYSWSYTPSYYYTIYRPYYSTFYVNRYLLRRPYYHYDPFYLPYYYYYPYYYSPSRYNYYSRLFDDETRLIRAHTASLLKRIHAPIPRVPRTTPLPYISRYDYDYYYPSKLTGDYIYRMYVTNPRNPKLVDYITYYSEPIRKYFGQGHLACISFAGDKSHLRRRNVWAYEDPVKNDIQLLSYYISKFRQEKAVAKDSAAVPLSASRPSRVFSVPRTLQDASVKKEIDELREARATRFAKIHAVDEEPSKAAAEDRARKNQKKRDEARLAEERALADEAARKDAQAKKEEAARKAEIARQEELAAKAAAERAAELERQAELTRQEELARQAAIDKARQEEEERGRLEEERRQAELVKAEEERQQLLRLEEIARQAEEEREAELARQAEELAELARQEAELAEIARKQEEEAEQRRKEEESAELARQEAELAELERQEKELAELARQEAELAEQSRIEAEQARKEAEAAELAQQEAEMAELERQQAELDALEREAKALEEDIPEPESTPAVTEEEEETPADDIPSPNQEDTIIPSAQEETTEEEAKVENEPIVEEPETPEPTVAEEED